MTYVTDTHALVFFASGNAARISRKCVQIFRRAQQERDRVHIPVVCFFELAILLERGRVKSSLSFDDWHDRVVQFPGLPIEPLVWEDIREARGLAALYARVAYARSKLGPAALDPLRQFWSRLTEVTERPLSA